MREKSAELFAKMLNDKLVGPRCRIILSKFLPVIFMDAMRDSPEASVHMFEGQLTLTAIVFSNNLLVLLGVIISIKFGFLAFLVSVFVFYLLLPDVK